MENARLRRAAAFHAVASTGSIAAAAARMGKSPPAIHHDLKCMEQELGRPLFSRVGRSLRLMPGARLLYESIARSLDEIDRASARFARASEEEHPLRIASVSGFARYRLAPRLFANAGETQPIELIMGTHEQVLEAVISQRADAAVTYRPVASVPVVARHLAAEDYVLIGAAGADEAPSLQAIEQLSFITYDEYEYVFARWFEEVFGTQPSRLRRLDHTTELEEALESVAAGRGATIVPADAWLNGPWRERCGRLNPAVASNELFILTVGGEAPPLLRKLLGA